MNEWDGVTEDQLDALRAQYLADPVGTDLAVIGATAQQVQNELAAQLHSAHYRDVAASQAEIVAEQAFRNVRAKFRDFDKVEAKVQQKLLTDGRQLIPDSMSPAVIEAALTDVVRLAGLEQAKEDEANYWQRIVDTDLHKYT